ncbi:MAG TPA: CHAT domain-containing protein, partial [Tepidisphaeraceae bacterium]|nr:CHAT domain-containing protein [Tepidisphaeraceae bacterium]
LHLATHGFFDLGAPPQNATPPADSAAAQLAAAVAAVDEGQSSGLVLAGANRPPEIPADPTQLDRLPDDGYLNAAEIAALPLGGAQLVVLSACESGLGAAAGGEGLLGVQRAFQLAGARTTIATLWKVNDETTRRIMEEFYRNYLVEKQTPLEALRRAQLWALENPELIPRGADPPSSSGPTTRLSPKLWAAFTVSGDWR